MKKILVATVALTLAASPALAENWYVSGNIGMASASNSDLTDSTVPGITIDIEYDSGLTLGAAIGYDYGTIRAEGELAYQKNDFDKASLWGVDVPLSGDATATSLLLNGYFDIENDSPVTPYITAGLGLAKIEVNNLNVPGSGLPGTSDDDTVFAYQIGAGLGYAINNRLTADVRYRYLTSSDPEFGTSEAEFASHNVTAGLRYSF